MNKRKIDFTEGSIIRKLLVFVFPIIATNILQIFYNAADMMIVSLSDEPNAVGAVGITGSFINLMTNLFIGFSVGANVVIARHIGAKSDAEAERATHTSILTAILLGIFCGTIGILISRTVLTWMGNTGNVLDLATKYTFLYFLGIPFISLTNVLVSIIRAKGDSKTPLIVLSISGIANVLLNFFFVLVVGLSVEGVAVATVLANVFSAFVLVVKLKRSDGPVSLSFKKLRIDRRSFHDIFLIGVPAAIQGALFSISNLLIQSGIVTVNNLLTPDPNLSPVLNGNAAQMNLDNFIYTAMAAVGHAASTFVSQNYGARKIKRIWSGLLISYGLVSVAGLSVSLLVLLFRVPLLSLYGVVNGIPGSADAIAYEAAYIRIIFITIPYFICGLMEVGANTIRSLGKPIVSFMITFFSAFIFRIFWTLCIFPMKVDLTTLFISYPISWIAAAIVAFVLASVYIKKMAKEVRKTERCEENDIPIN